MPGLSGSRQEAAGTVHLLDGNVLYALIDEANVHHAPARQWFPSVSGGFATCPITQGTLVRLVMRLGGHGVEPALALLAVAPMCKRAKRLAVVPLTSMDQKRNLTPAAYVMPRVCPTTRSFMPTA